MAASASAAWASAEGQFSGAKISTCCVRVPLGCGTLTKPLVLMLAVSLANVVGAGEACMK